MLTKFYTSHSSVHALRFNSTNKDHYKIVSDYHFKVSFYSRKYNFQQTGTLWNFHEQNF